MFSLCSGIGSASTANWWNRYKGGSCFCYSNSCLLNHTGRQIMLHTFYEFILSDALVVLQVDKVTSDIKSNNVRLKENLYKVAESWSEWSIIVLTLYMLPRFWCGSNIEYLGFLADEIEPKFLHWHCSAVYNSGNCLISIQVSISVRVHTEKKKFNSTRLIS